MHEIICLPYGYFEANCYVLRLPSSACLIDPAIEAERLPPGLPPVHWIIATHGHFDHISHADILRQTTGAPFFIHRSEADYLLKAQLNLSVTMQRSTVLKPADQLLEDRQIIDLTDGYQLEVLHTPGHTPGGVCLVLLSDNQPIALFSGDTLFAGSIGRLDLGGSLPDMVKTLDRLKKFGRSLDQDITVYPGHGSSTSLWDEIQYNPYFRMKPEQ